MGYRSVTEGQPTVAVGQQGLQREDPSKRSNTLSLNQHKGSLKLPHHERKSH